jgi:hypothetical protein
MYFSADDLRRIREEYALLHDRYANLMLAYNQRNYRFPVSSEYANHGFLRRLGTLLRSIENVFEKIPPDRGDDPPPRNDLLDATISIQAFVFNVFGAIDNLAWVWVSEAQITREDGTPLPGSWIGFGPKNVRVRRSLPERFRRYLDSVNVWFEHLENFRHALAHRIPLYIPPYTVSPDQEGDWRALEAAIMTARLRGDREREGQLAREQRALCRFRPWMTHSYSEQSRPVVFHAQLISDFLTLEELAQRLLHELPDRMGCP